MQVRSESGQWSWLVAFGDSICSDLFLFFTNYETARVHRLNKYQRIISKLTHRIRSVASPVLPTWNFNRTSLAMDEDMSMDAGSGYGLQPAFEEQSSQNSMNASANTGDPGRKQLQVSFTDHLILVFLSNDMADSLIIFQRSRFCPGLYRKSRNIYLFRNEKHRIHLCPHFWIRQTPKPRRPSRRPRCISRPSTTRPHLYHQELWILIRHQPGTQAFIRSICLWWWRRARSRDCGVSGGP